MIKPGDEIIVSCVAARARVRAATSDYVLIEWPWRDRDPSSQVEWNGLVALPRDEFSEEWSNTPWRTDPAAWELEAGRECTVGIPPTRVLVRQIQEYDPPRNLGWRPMPVKGLSVVQSGGREDDEDAGYVLYLDSGEPVRIDPASAGAEDG